MKKPSMSVYIPRILCIYLKALARSSVQCRLEYFSMVALICIKIFGYLKLSYIFIPSSI